MSVTFKDDVHRILKFVANCNGRFEDSKCDIRESPLGGLGVLQRLILQKVSQY